MTEEKSFWEKLTNPITVAFVLITLLFFTILFGYSWVYEDNRSDAAIDAQILRDTQTLSEENANRIKDIQASRVSSCQLTYSGIKEVFKPFIPTHPTNQQQLDFIDKFNSTIERLQKGCVNQTDPDNNGGG